MAISKVVYGNTTLIDISEDTVSAAAMLSGVTAHKSNGEAITGNINTKTSADLSASGSIVTVPSGYYASSVSKSVATATHAAPTITVNGSGLITATHTAAAGYVTAGTTSATKQLPTMSAQSVTPDESEHTLSVSGYYMAGDVTIKAVSSNYVGSNIIRRDDSDLSATGSVVTAPAGYYSADASTTIAAGSFSALPVTTNPTIGTVSIDSSTGVITVTRSSQTWSNVIQANATQAGYISANMSSTNDLTVGASSTTYALSALSATNYTPGTATQTIAAGQYLTGVQTIAGDTNLIAANIAEGVTIFDIVGTHSGGIAYETMDSQDIWTAVVSGWGS